MDINLIMKQVVSVIEDGGLKFAGFYPDAIMTNIGNNLPSFAIRIGDEDDFDTNKTGCYFSSLLVKVYVYDNKEYSKALSMTELQESIISLFMKDQSLSNTVHCVEIYSVSRGDAIDESIDHYNEGYYQGLSVGSVSFIFNICRL